MPMVRFENPEGLPIYVNPEAVSALHPEPGDVAVTLIRMLVLSEPDTLRVRMPVDEVAQLLRGAA
jgi:hypothetical protein